MKELLVVYFYIDIEKIADPVEKQAAIGIIHNFGQSIND
jgi:hypothetical protein